MQFHVLNGSRHLLREAKKVPARYALADAIAVFRKSGFYIVFLLLIAVGFIFLNPGKDVIYMLMDTGGSKWALVLHWVFTFAGILFWSMSMEFGARYAVYVSDNSGKSLSAERVEWRKTVQQAASAIFLIAPFVVSAISIIACFFEAGKTVRVAIRLPFLCAMALLYIFFIVVTQAYFRKRKSKKLQRRNSSGIDEVNYENKLYGIYNDYVFNIRKAGNFPDDESYKQFIRDIQNDIEGFPKSRKVAEDGRVPASFELVDFDDTGERPSDGAIKWTYKIPLNFYAQLHKQLRRVFIASLSCVILMLTLGVWCTSYRIVGAPGLAFLSFASWGGLYSCLLYVDYGAWRDKRFSLRFILVLLFLISSFTHGHDVRLLCDNASQQDKRLPLGQHFNRWFNRYAQRSPGYTQGSDTMYPVVFICAEGGALRTGAYTALFLSCLQDSLKERGIDFKQSIYAFSSVSGGSLGVNFFEAIANNGATEHAVTNYAATTHSFFAEDFLSPTLGRMLYGDIVNSFSPLFIHQFDRAAALEEGWENGYAKAMPKARNVFAEDFQSCFTDSVLSATYPALFINTTEVETGLQCWVTNVNANDSGFDLAANRDLLHQKISNGLRFSTAIDFSTRFPAISPAGCLKPAGCYSFHYVDGGYVENTGAATMLQILHQLAPRFKDQHIKPYVIMLRFSNDSMSKGASRIHFGNEAVDILGAIVATRGGRTNMAQQELYRYVRQSGGEYIDLPLEEVGKAVPENWVLSERSWNSLQAYIDTVWKDRYKEPLGRLYCIDTTCRKLHP